MNHVATDMSLCFWCYSDSADYEYVVEVDYPSDLEKAKEIAQRELDYYGCPEESPDPDYYFNVGYVEVVETALNKAGIKADFYTKVKED